MVALKMGLMVAGWIFKVACDSKNTTLLYRMRLVLPFRYNISQCSSFHICNLVLECRIRN